MSDENSKTYVDADGRRRTVLTQADPARGRVDHEKKRLYDPTKDEERLQFLRDFEARHGIAYSDWLMQQQQDRRSDRASGDRKAG